jgi:hypothetical protein
MREHLLRVWPETWRHLWVPLNADRDAPPELFPELYREFGKPPRRPAPPSAPSTFDESGQVDALTLAAQKAYQRQQEEYGLARAAYEEAIENPLLAEQAFQDVVLTNVKTEQQGLSFLCRAHKVLSEFGDSGLDRVFASRVQTFISLFNLGYQIEEPFDIRINLIGLFGDLVHQLRTVATGDVHLKTLFAEFEAALADSTVDYSSGRIKSSLLKQFNLLEALGRRCAGVQAKTLGDVANEITTWPHSTVREALKKIYGFRSDYPGLGHSGNLEAANRELDIRDLVALSIVLIGFAPYVTVDLNLAALSARG